MSQSGDPPAGNRPSAPAESWRGTARSARERTERNWQQGGTVQPLTRLRLRDKGLPLRVAGLLLLVFLFSALWVYGLLFKAVKAPMIVVAATDYQWPLPPNAWVREDLDRLGHLHGKTLQLVEASAEWNAGEHAMLDFHKKLSEAVNRRSGASAILIYVSMHGAVDGAGNPCLIPPGGSPLDAKSWVKVSDFLDGLKNIRNAGNRNKILVLDCNRMQANWRLGLLYNSFSDHLQQVVLEAQVENLVVLNSAGPGQVGWSSPELGGSAFGHFFGRALAGEADADRNRQISVGELHDYLRLEVDRWAVRNRAVRQEPMLIAEKTDLRQAVAWVPARRASLPALHRQPEVVADRILRELWSHHDRWQELSALRFAPLQWQSFQNRLLWLEQLNGAGNAYRKRAEEVLEELQALVAKQSEAGAAISGGVAARRQLWDPDAEITIRGLIPHSLPLALHFGVALPATAGDASLLLTEAASARLLRQTHAGNGGDTPAAQSQELDDLLALLERGEQVAVPDDERVAPWLSGSVAAADRARREAEDAWLAGDIEQTRQAGNRAIEAQRLAQDCTDLVAKAFFLRDQALAEVPYLAKWLAGEPPCGKPEMPVAESSLRLTSLIENLHTLGEQLSQPEPGFVYVTEDTAPFAKTRQTVQDDLDWLHDKFQNQVVALTKTQQATPETLRRLQALLAAPLIDASQRLKLRGNLAAIDAELCEAGNKAEPAVATPSAGEPATVDYLAWLDQHWMPHPALQLLQPNWIAGVPKSVPAEEKPAVGEQESTALPASPALAKYKDAEGEAVRHLLRESMNFAPTTQQPVGSRAMAVSAGDSAWRAALLLQSRQDRLARAAAAWRQPPLNFDPVASRRNFDLQSLLLMQAERTLHDFLGPVDGKGEPFFRVAARDYLQGMSLCGDTEPALARLRDELQSRIDNANFSLQIAIENVLLVNPDDPVETGLSLGPGDSPLASHAGQGRLSLFVRAGEQRLPVQFEASSDPGTPREMEDVPSRIEVAFPLAQTQRWQLRGENLAIHGPRLDMVGGFRGHEVVAPWLVQTMGGVTVDFRTPGETTTTVLVKGTRRQRKSFVFVLDCSDSMKQLIEVEATDGQQIQRLEIAKSALQGMLDQLAGETDTRVGVRFFGHRVGWSTAEPVRVLRRKDYLREIPLELAPSEDVELILPLGRFDSLLAGQVEDLFASVKPWGQTPLYRALVDAIGDFERDDPDTEKHIILITDGVNYQFTPSASGQFAAPQPVTVDDVASAWEKQKPAIHLVGFGIPAEEIPAAEAEYRGLIDRMGGTYQTSVDKAQELLQTLDQLLAKATYEVLAPSGDSVGRRIGRDGSLGGEPAAARLGEPLAIQHVSLDGEFKVACQQALESILLRGGEAAEFELSADGRRLESVRYGAPLFGQLIPGNGGERVGDQFGVHRPIVENDGARFEFSLQHPQQRFTARPAEIWIEVTPLDADGKPVTSAYTFYDAVFAADVPVPLIRWFAKGWPVLARKARVDCWYKETTTTAADDVVKALDVPPAPADRRSFATFPGIEFQIESSLSAADRTIRVVEWHGEGSAGVGSLKVDLIPTAGATLPPMRVIRTFDPDNRVAAHVFVLPGDTATDWEIQLTTAAALRKDAIRLETPIDVPLAENIDQLPPLSSARGR